MLPPAEIVACETCGGVAQRDAAGRTRGEALLLELRAALSLAAELPVSVSSVRCLWACKRSCAVAVRSASRVGYVIADLEPSEPTAHALLEYAARYARSADGAVPYREWPALLKGHFLCRFPSFPEAAPAAAVAPPAAVALPAAGNVAPPAAGNVVPPAARNIANAGAPDAEPGPPNPDEPARSRDEQLP